MWLLWHWPLTRENNFEWQKQGLCSVWAGGNLNRVVIKGPSSGWLDFERNSKSILPRVLGS